YIFSKDLEAGPNIRIDYLEDNELVRSTWDSRDEEFEDLKFEDFLTLYKKLEEKISKLINTIYPNWIQK
ncbi:TPA: hypothetical protein OV720_003396, partial [Acinetobacter baumannii]|nr:hypothetical protein [Acinetobacter baumannii]